MSQRAYDILDEAGLLTSKFLLESNTTGSVDIKCRKANTTYIGRIQHRLVNQHKTILIKKGNIGFLRTGTGDQDLLGEGCHAFEHCKGYSLAYYDHRTQINYSDYLAKDGSIVWENITIAEVKPGHVGVAEAGEKVFCLPPGVHQWKDSLLTFSGSYNLADPVVKLGVSQKYTLVSVDEGYSAITTDNGRLDIKEGGNIYFLAHRNHKFCNFVPHKVQVDPLSRSIKCATADNVVVQFEGSVNWKIEDVEIAAKNSVETMEWGGNSKSNLLDQIREDVMEQTKASLSIFIGNVNYSDNFGISSGKGSNIRPGVDNPDAEEAIPIDGKFEEPATANAWVFNPENINKMVENANELTERIGVKIYRINILSVYPEDKMLQQSLAQGAVAAALAQKEETAARGKAKADIITATEKAESLLIDARAQALATEIKAKADAKAKEERAKGAIKAAEMLSGNPLAQDLAKIEASVGGLDGKTKFFFGSSPAAVQNLLANPNVIKKDI